MKVVSDKPLRIAAPWGAVVVLQPNEPRELGDDIATLAMQEGAKIVGEAAEPEPVEVLVIEDVPQVDSRMEKLVEVMKELIAEGDPASFTAANTPKAVVVNRKFGDTVLTDEREEAWKIASGL